MSDTKAVDLFADFATDQSKEEEGVWETYAEGVEFLVARSGNKTFSRMISHDVKKNQRLLDSGTDAAAKKSEEIMVNVMAKSILLDWKGSFEWQGKPMGEYSVEKAKQMLAVKGFRQWVTSVADDMQRFKSVQEEEEAGK
jgi:hypothetical protein